MAESDAGFFSLGPKTRIALPIIAIIALIGAAFATGAFFTTVSENDKLNLKLVRELTVSNEKQQENIAKQQEKTNERLDDVVHTLRSIDTSLQVSEAKVNGRVTALTARVEALEQHRVDDKADFTRQLENLVAALDRRFEKLEGQMAEVLLALNK